MFKINTGLSFFSSCFLLLTSSILLSSCQKDHAFDCFKGTGDEVTEERTIAGFNRIYANNNVDVIIHPGNDYKIKVTAGKKLLDGITTTVKNNTLEIKNENKCNWVRSFKNKFSVEVWLPELQELNAYGSGAVTLKDTVHFDGFTFNNWNASGSVLLLFNNGNIHINIHVGPADITMKGSTGINYFYHNGNGPVHAEELHTDITYTENKGTNDSYVFAEELLWVKLSYIGNIYYKGNPDSVKITGDGSGKLIPL